MQGAYSNVTIMQLSVSFKVIEKEFESFKERARDELARAKLEVWEKEYLIRQQVSNEYNEQIVEIEDKHRLVDSCIRWFHFTGFNVVRLYK